MKNTLDENVVRAEEAINCKDSVMEQNIFEIIEILIKEAGWKPETIVQRLVDNYVGYAQMCHLVSCWLAIAKSTSSEAALFSTTQFDGTSTLNGLHVMNKPDGSGILLEAERVLIDKLSLVIRKRFNKSAADELLDKGIEVPAWIVEMIQFNMWRKVLIELFDENRGSALLGYCLRRISKLGYHRCNI